LLAIFSALIIVLLIGAVAFKMKDKLKILEKANKNMRSLVFGGLCFFLIALLFKRIAYLMISVIASCDVMCRCYFACSE